MKILEHVSHFVCIYVQKGKMTHILNFDLNQYMVTIYHWMDLLTNLMVAIRAQEQV